MQLALVITHACFYVNWKLKLFLMAFCDWYVNNLLAFVCPVISLIALLRMGLLEEIKTQFYDKFLKLPYYEDMAPWNIGNDNLLMYSNKTS